MLKGRRDVAFVWGMHEEDSKAEATHMKRTKQTDWGEASRNKILMELSS